MILPFLVFRLRISDGLCSDRASPLVRRCRYRDQAREEATSPGIWRSGEFDLDYDRFALVPFIQIAQAIGKIFERSVLRQHVRKLTVRERHSHAARPRLVVMEVEHSFLRILVIERGLVLRNVTPFARTATSPAGRLSCSTIAASETAAVDSETT